MNTPDQQARADEAAAAAAAATTVVSVIARLSRLTCVCALALAMSITCSSARAHSVSSPAAFGESAAHEPLAWAGSNFTTYIADRETNATWPAPARLSEKATRHAERTTARPPVGRVALQSPLELAFFQDDPEEEDEEQEEQEQDEDDDEAALEALGAHADGDQDVELELEPEAEDFYSTKPVETINWALRRKPKLRPKAKGGPSVGTPQRFDDFDDLEALRLKTFYSSAGSEPTESRNATRRRGPRQSAGARTAESKRTTKGKRKKRKGKGKTKKKGRKKRKRKKNENTGRLRGRGSGRGGRPLGQQVAATAVAGSERQQSQRLDSLALVAGQQCAFVSQTGACVSYLAVEWALGQARRLIGFRRPGSLGSLEPDEATIHAVGELTEWTSRLLALRFGLAGDDLTLGLEQVDTSRTSLWRTCPRLFRSPAARQCYTGPWRAGAQPASVEQAILLSGRYRTHTGQCNNPLVPNYGSSFMPFVRLAEPEYGDGLGSIRVASASGQQLPPARLVSLLVHPSLEVASSDHSALFAAWGQLINHDLALASGARVATGHEGSCCARLARANLRLSDPLNRVCMPIFIGADDPVYAPYGVRCHDFKRSIAGLRPGCSLGPRTQLNLVTPFVDASFVYGSTRSTGAALRSGGRRRPGQLAVWHYFGARRQPLLPPQLEEADDECVNRPDGLYCFRSGDSRTNQQVPLVVLHTIHARQHNRLARALALVNPHWGSERLYAEARRIHIAQVQHILLSEYLPELLGERQLAKFQLDEAPPNSPHWDHYDATLNPAVSQEFAAAAFRQGHSSVPGLVFRLDPVTRAPLRAHRLRELFRQPWALFEARALDEFLAGLVDTPAQAPDPFVSLELAGHLLEGPRERVGLDLVAVNLQRGRDQGLASYNSMRDWCGLGRLADFESLARALNSKQSAQALASLYESVDDIDLYSGGLSEPPLAGAQVGPTFACILGHQFGLLRRADRHWFETSEGPQAFTSAQLASIKQVPLARLVCANSDELALIQPLAMRLPHPIYNPLGACSELPELDLSLWFEPPGPTASAQASDEDED